MTLKEFVNQMLEYSDKTNSNYSKWFYKKGQFFNKINTSESDQLCKLFRSELKMCYINCAKICLLTEKYDYYEGYVSVYGVPLQHAFLVNKKGEVVDPTLAIREENHDEKTNDLIYDDYFGHNIPKKDLQKIAFKKKSGDWLIAYYQKKEKKNHV